MLASLIAAVAENGIIGREGQLPWRLSSDLRRFKTLTMGHPIIMGRRTWDSIGRPLPGRTSIVVTRKRRFRPTAEEVLVAYTLEAALDEAETAPGGDKEAFVIGGAEIYAAALPLVSRMYFTRVLADVAGDAAFPSVAWDEWRLLSSERHEADDNNEFAHAFEMYERVP